MTASRFPFGQRSGLRWEIGTNLYFMVIFPPCSAPDATRVLRTVSRYSSSRDFTIRSQLSEFERSVPLGSNDIGLRGRQACCPKTMSPFRFEALRSPARIYAPP